MLLSRWEIGKFGQCSKTCGRGTRQRRVVCKYIPETGDEARSAGATEMNELLCPSPKPTESEPCGLSECPPEWVTTGWSQVSLNQSPTLARKLRFANMQVT